MIAAILAGVALISGITAFWTFPQMIGGHDFYTVLFTISVVAFVGSLAGLFSSLKAGIG